jgi:hypothetical protein
VGRDIEPVLMHGDWRCFTCAPDSAATSRRFKAAEPVHASQDLQQVILSGPRIVVELEDTGLPFPTDWSPGHFVFIASSG